MIIVDDQDSEQQTQLDAVGAGRVKSGPDSMPATATPGPSYIPSHGNPPPSPPPPYNLKHHNNQNIPSPLVSQYSRSPARRFWSAFAVAFLIYFAFLGATRTVIDMATHRIFRGDGAVGVPLAEDGNVLRSVGSLNWTSYQSRPWWKPEFRESAETSFTLPLASEELYLISRGSYQSGQVELKQLDEAEDVKVNIRVAYKNDQALARATVCQLRKDGNRNGIGIYTPTTGWHSPTDQLYFEVTVIFPSARPGHATLRINRFTTHTSNYGYVVGDLWQTMIFDNIQLNTSNGHMKLRSITVSKGSLKSSNGAIEGHFNSSDSLSLHTSNGPIKATAALLSTGGHDAKLNMHTSNGAITSVVTLTADSGSGGNFNVTARTSNGNVDLRYDDSPLRSHLTSQARTSNGQASVQMHPAFEGSFEISSTMRPTVDDTHPTDPSGAGRRRIVNQNTSRRQISGSVYWGTRDDRGRTIGSSTVHTTNGQAVLRL